MKENKGDIAQIERDYKYYKEKDNESDECVYFLLKERYYNRYRIAEKRFYESLKKAEGENK